MWKTSVLVVANVTADSDELRDALLARAARGSTDFTMLVPMHGVGAEARAAAEAQLQSALGRLREAGLEVQGLVGDSDPIAAVSDCFSPARFDALVVATLPTGTSRWLAFDLPHRIERMTGVPVSHVVVHGPRVRLPAGAPPHHGRSPLGPLAVLGWGSRT